MIGLLLTRSPLGSLVRWVAGVRASIHTKLLVAFLVVAALFIATGAMSLQTVRDISHQSRFLDEAHKRVDLSREIEHALALQMNYTEIALILGDESAIARIHRADSSREQPLQQQAGPDRGQRAALGARNNKPYLLCPRSAPEHRGRYRESDPRRQSR
jgi:hypothetical protein